MEPTLAYGLLIATIGLFGYIGYNAASGKDIEVDEYLAARGSQSSMRIALSLFASGMGVWILFGPSEVGYWGGFWDVVGYALSSATPFLLLAYVGPKIRSSLPDGVTLADYVRARLGRTMQIYVGIISILYMFTFLFAEFTAIGKASSILGGLDPLIPMILIAAATASYTALGGLPASLATDRIQALTVIALLTGLGILLMAQMFSDGLDEWINQAKAFNPEDEWSIGSMSYMDSFASGLALIIAITAAEMFSQGNWQRTHASESPEALQRGALIASMMVFPLVLIMGILGTVVAGRGAPMFGDVYDPSAAFFILIADAGTLILILFLVLAVALVCSSADTLLNAITASVTRDLSDGRMNLSQARIVTIGLMPVAVYLATGPTVLGFTFDASSVFGIFLFADLLAAATVAPVLLTLWNRITSEGALAGAISGFLGVILYGTYTEDYMKGIEYIYKPVNEYGLANLNVFLSALIASGIVTILVSIATASEPGLTTTEEE
ncbi:MAG TPA: hypothetical protein HA345_00435 [Candidatus Thalassarchaeaceae archaeon]|nr:MAG TPA: hypothetical protein D7H94_00435 [Candidatus Poseidoniales archaeon]HIH83853.1 hypothetical protein [Candidatus Thalassarchaeaceae archaeon]